MEYLAHIRVLDHKETQIQTVAEHCRAAAAYSEQCLEACGLPQAGYLAALLHDAGKCKQEFQSYLMEGEGKRGSVNHTFAGCRMMLEHFHGENSERFEDVTSELLGFAIGAHHGLFDCIGPQQSSGFLHRMEKEKIYYEESRDAFLACCADWRELERRFEGANRELSAVYEKLLSLSSRNGDETREEFSFSLGLTARLLASAVIEGDRRDTAAFMKGASPPPEQMDWNRFWMPYLDRVERKLAALPRETPVQQARAEISDRCRSFAESPPGIYRLHVPTGGGKTLSSLRFALAHAAKWGKKRVFFVTPLLAILEQNAGVIREYLGDDSIVLEHHSNVIQTEEAEESLDFRELAVESWHAPVILTTMVQLLNTLFLGKTTSVRRFHGLCDAVVVIDEVQTVPNHMLTLFNLTLNFLSEICRTTFLLCSATQPCFEQADHPLILTKPVDAVPFDATLWKPFSRTSITDAGRKRLEEFPAFLSEIQAESLLVVCNKKSESEFLYRTLSETTESCFHLSASMCPAHRRKTLDQIREALRMRRGKVVCISTQVIEAGVDISFQSVVRLAAGMDQIVQAAGRCNRNGEDSTPVPVYVVQCSDESLGRLREIQRAKTVTTGLLEEFKNHPEAFQDSLSSDEAIRWYYRKLYANMEEGFQDYTLPEQRNTLFSLLGSNARSYTGDCGFYGKFTLAQAFHTAGSLFHVFDEDTVDVVVPYGEGAGLISELISQTNASILWLEQWTQRAKPYTISLYAYQKQLLSQALRSYNGVLVLLPEFYNPRTGLSLISKSKFLEV